MRFTRRRRGERGLTLIELIVAFTILLILTTMAVPLARSKVRIERPTLSRRKFISGRLGGSKGLTLVELMVVISIIVILITMAIPIYNNTIRRAKETVLKQNLFSLRTVIDNYTYDKQKAPQTLQ